MYHKIFVFLLLGIFASNCCAKANSERAFLVLHSDSKYILPNDETVVVKNSTTCGLQEAIDRAVAENFDLYIAGGDYKNKVYHCTTSVIFPPLQGKVIKFGAATINFDGFADPSQPGMVFDSCMNVTMECNAQIVYHMNGTALKFQPQKLLPVDDFVGPTMVASRFHFAAIAHVNTPVAFVGKQGNIPKDNTEASCVAILPTKSISRCEFHFIELLGGNFGLRIETPAQGSNFSFNHLKGLFVHEQFNTSISEGTIDQSPLNNTIIGNQWNVHCAPSPDARAVDVHGSRGVWTINTIAEKGNLQSSLSTHNTTQNNTFTIPTHDGKFLGPFTPEKPGTNQFR